MAPLVFGADAGRADARHLLHRRRRWAVHPRRHARRADAAHRRRVSGHGAFDSRAGDPAKARDPQRILEVAKLAGVSRIDYLLVTHFHGDHVGGVPELAQLIPIGTFIDHGGVTADAERVAGTMAIHRRTPRSRERTAPRAEAGERLPLKGVEAIVVSSAGATLAAPLAGAAPGANAACTPPGIPAQETTENPRSTGILLQFGRFRFLDVGDLGGAPLFSLACPSDLIGPVDVYLVAHHGGADASDPSCSRRSGREWRS